MPRNEKPIRVLIVEDHALVRDMLARTISAEPGMQVVGASGSVTEAMDFLRDRQADVVLLDYDLGDERADKLLRQARREEIDTPMLVVTAWASDQEVRQLVTLGAAGVIRKERPLEELMEALRMVAGGQAWFEKHHWDLLVKPRKAGAESASPDLTARERKVIRCLPDGLSNKEIAACTGLSENMVKLLLQRLYAKTGARTRAELVRLALENKWVMQANGAPGERE